jgi:hypothetical protein
MIQRSAFFMLAVVAMVIGAAVPVAATDPGPVRIPALIAEVQDACTHNNILPAVQSVMTTAAGRRFSPSHTAPGAFRYGTLPAGKYRLFVSASGYEDLADATGAGVNIVEPARPGNVPAGEFVDVGLYLVVRLAPTIPPGPCKAQRPANVPGAFGIVHDVKTGARVAGMAVRFSDPTTGLEPPGPPIKIATGRFTQPELPAGTWLLHLSAPGYTGLDISVKCPPGPPVLPSDANGIRPSVAMGLRIGIALSGA